MSLTGPLGNELVRNWLDVVVIAIVLLAMAQGWSRGFLAFSFDLLGLVLSFLVALRYYSPLAAWAANRLGIDTAFNKPLAFVVLAAAVGVGIALVADALLRAIPVLVRRNPVNRLLGLLPGALNGLITAAVLLTLAVTLPTGPVLEHAVQESALAGSLVASVTAVEARLRPVFGEAIAELLTFQTVPPEADATLDLPFTVPEPVADPAAEEEMLRLVNAERLARGLDPVVMDDALREVARAHALDMLQRGYFSHYSPEGLSPFDRMRAANVRYLSAGENLALAPTVEVAHAGLMNSPGHRRNILSPEFRRIGIGAMDGGLRGIMFAQEFTN